MRLTTSAASRGTSAATSFVAGSMRTRPSGPQAQIASGLEPSPWQRRPAISTAAMTSLVSGSMRYTDGTLPSFMIGPSTESTQSDPNASVSMSGPPGISTLATCRAPSGSWDADGSGAEALGAALAGPDGSATDAVGVDDGAEHPAIRMPLANASPKGGGANAVHGHHVLLT